MDQKIKFYPKQIIDLFQKEFNLIEKHFYIYELLLEEAKTSKAEHIWKPGVYVFWHPERGVIKVGRHLTNARKRALEHLRDNTGGIMSKLNNDSETRLLLFNVINPAKYHWVAAVEIFFELSLKPEIKSKRTG